MGPSCVADLPEIIQPVSNIEVPDTVDLQIYITRPENSVPAKYSDNQHAYQALRYVYNFSLTTFTITGNNKATNSKFASRYGYNTSYCGNDTTIMKLIGI